MYNFCKKQLAKSVFYLLLLAIVILQSCENKPKPIETKVICHRGSGVNFTIINEDSIFENTMAAVKYGFQYFDGIEIDIQISLNSTIWVYHNSDLYNFDSAEARCIPSSDDDIINLINSKVTNNQKLCMLEEVFAYHKKHALDDIISLDVKGYFEETCLSGRNISNEYEISIADEIIRLAESYNLQEYVLVETNYTKVLDRIKSKSDNIECYYLAYNQFDKNLEKVLENNYDGLSFNFRDSSLTTDAIQKAHRKGIKVQIWTIAWEEDFQKALALKADFIQSDIVLK